MLNNHECEVFGCKEDPKKRRLCKKHQAQLRVPLPKLQWSRHHEISSLEERLASKLLKVASGCIEFQGAKNDGGYGVLRAGGKTHRAHRLAWEFANGPIPAGLLVCHTCDNRSCCNVEHLFLGRHLENHQDMDYKGRRRNGSESLKQGAN